MTQARLPNPSVHGTRVVVHTHEDFVQLVQMPASLRGEWNPEKLEGFVWFDTSYAAILAWRTL